MAGLHAVKTLVPHVDVPGYGIVDVAQTTVNITQDAFNLIPAAAFSGGSPALQDMGAVPDPTDGVNTQAANVTAPAALTSTDTTSPNAVNPANAAYTLADQTALAVLANELKTDHNALRADVTALRATVATLLTALTGVGKPMHT